MTPNEAVANWVSGNRRSVRKACMDDQGLVTALGELMSKADYQLLLERIETHKAVGGEIA